MSNRAPDPTPLPLLLLRQALAATAACLLTACGGGSDSAPPAQVQSVACDPLVGIYTTATQGTPSAASNAAVVDVVRRLQQTPSLGIVPVSKVTGFEEPGVAQYQLVYAVDSTAFRVVDAETAQIIDSGTASGSLDELLAYLRAKLRPAIDRHDQAISGSGVPVDVAQGACADVIYRVNSTQGRVVARSSVGSLGGTLQPDGSSTLRVSAGAVEGFRLAVPLDAAPGNYSVSVQGVCRYRPSRALATLDAVSVQVKAATMMPVEIADDFAKLDGGPHHSLALESGAWSTGILSPTGVRALFLSGKASIAFGSSSAAVISRAALVVQDNCFSAGCTTLTLEGFDAQGAARSITVEARDGKRVAVDSVEQGFAKVSRLRLNSLEAAFSELRASGSAPPVACKL